jgi:hypothetical protein
MKGVTKSKEHGRVPVSIFILMELHVNLSSLIVTMFGRNIENTVQLITQALICMGIN